MVCIYEEKEGCYYWSFRNDLRTNSIPWIEIGLQINE